MPPSPSYQAEMLHATLGEGFFDEVAPAQFPKHVLRYRNQRWAARVGLDHLTDALPGAGGSDLHRPEHLFIDR